jgi:hypothetical protein
MTEAQQRRFYFPNWNGCAVANGWLMRRGRLGVDLAAQLEEFRGWPEPAGPGALQVVVFAEQWAQQQHRAVNADDLRYGCNWVATCDLAKRRSGATRGKIHSADLSNRETQHTVTLFKLLTDPDDLDAVMDWLNPERQEKASYISYLLKRMDEAAIIAIARNAFELTPGNQDWRELPTEKLRWICKQGKHRKSRRQFWRDRLAEIERVAPAGHGVPKEMQPY